MTPFGHAKTRSERIADWFMFGAEVYMLLALVGLVAAAFLGALKPEYAQGFKVGLFCGFILPLVAYWVYHDFRALRSGARAASVDTHAEHRDVKQARPARVGSAVGSEASETPKEGPRMCLPGEE
jgi:hypothetical protein